MRKKYSYSRDQMEKPTLNPMQSKEGFKETSFLISRNFFLLSSIFCFQTTFWTTSWTRQIEKEKKGMRTEKKNFESWRQERDREIPEEGKRKVKMKERRKKKGDSCDSVLLRRRSFKHFFLLLWHWV